MGNSLKDNFEDFIEQTSEERTRAETRRDFRDLKQWTDNEVATLEERDQAAIVFDQFGKKVDSIGGLEVQRRSDPKAYPMTPKHEKAADAITDALRYVETNTAFDAIASEVFEDKIVEGYGGCITEYDPEMDQIKITQLDWDRIYFDPHSRRKDFSDATYFGITLWMDRAKAKARFSDKADEIDQMLRFDAADGTTFEDRPQDTSKSWTDRKRDRVRINQEYKEVDGVWMEVFFSGDTVLVEEKPSPYLDANGKPACPIELASDFVDRDNNRYGYMQRLIDVQRELNHRRSKALHMLSNVTIIADRGAFGDVPRHEVLDEISQGKTFLEPMTGARVEIDRQQELGQTQLGFYQDAQQAMDQVGINPELTGTAPGSASGIAIKVRQQSGMVELEKIFTRHGEWKQRVYNQCWARIKQFWTEEKWVRVTDNEDAMKFVGLNIPITAAELLVEQTMGGDILELREQPEIQQIIQQAVQNNPALGQVAEKRNDVAQLSMDIVIEEAPDTVSIQQEQFDTFANVIGSGADRETVAMLLKLSSLSKKDEVLEMLEGKEEDQAQRQQMQEQQMQEQQEATRIQLENVQADTLVKQSTAQKNMADIPLKGAQTKDELASAMQRVGNVATMPFDQNDL